METTGGWPRAAADLFLFAFLLFLCDRLLYFGLQKWETRLARYDKQMGAFKASGAFHAYDILVLGSSRAFEGVHPFYLSRGLKKTVYKEAYAGKGPRFNYFFYQEFKRRFPVPKLVIYGIDYFIYSLQSNRLLLARLGVGQEREERRLRPLLLLSDKPRFDDLLIRTQEFITVRLLGRRPEDDRDQAFMASYVGSPARPLLEETEPPRFKKFFFRKYPGKEGEFLLRLLEELRRDGVPVCLLILPDHVGTLRSNSNQRMFRREMRRLSREFANAFVCDLGDPDLFPVGRSDYFLNGGYGQSNSHLSRAGAALLNELLIRELKTRLNGALCPRDLP